MRSGSRMQFSDVTERLLGRSVSPSQAAAEAQADWDYEDTLSPAIRKAIASQRDQEETVATYALAVAENALKTMRAFDEPGRSEEHTSELQSLMRNSYAVFCL